MPAFIMIFLPIASSLSHSWPISFSRPVTVSSMTFFSLAERESYRLAFMLTEKLAT